MGLLSIAYKWLPKSLIHRLGSSGWLKPLRDMLIRPFGRDKITKVKVNWGKGSFYFYAPIKMAVKAQRSGIENKLLRQSLKVMELHNQQNMQILDVGANYGFVSLAMRANLGTKAKLVAFEPHPEISKCVCKSVEANNFKDIQVEQMAVGDKEDFISINFYGQTSNIQPVHGAPVSTGSVWQTTLDAYVAKNHIHIDFVKIDVDGYEYKVIEGMQNTLLKVKPVVVIEVNNDVEIINLLESMQYHVVDMNFMNFDKAATLPLNVFCFPKSKMTQYQELFAK
jgi:FkbM family methyltransferase